MQSIGCSHITTDKRSLILINGPLRPPRAYRRRVRAIFDQAIKSNDQTSLTINALKGHLNYLQSFKNMASALKKLNIH